MGVGPAPSERTCPQTPERPHPTLGSWDTPRAGPASPCGFLASCAPLSKVLNQAPHTLSHTVFAFWETFSRYLCGRICVCELGWGYGLCSAST